jgi:hypothetical protein
MHIPTYRMCTIATGTESRLAKGDGGSRELPAAVDVI